MSNSVQLAHPPVGTIILARPLSELYATVSNKKLPALELIIRAIKTLALAIFRGHFYDRLALSNNLGILNSFTGKAEILTCEEMQKKYPYLLENAHVLILKQPVRSPDTFGRIGDFANGIVDAYTLGKCLFNNRLMTSRDLLKSEAFNHQAFIQLKPTDDDLRRKLTFILKEGSLEELNRFKADYPVVYQTWRERQLMDQLTVLDVAISYRNVKLARSLAQTEEKINNIIDDYHYTTPLQRALVLGDPVVIETLVSRGASLSVLDHGGNNMMHYAALSGKIELVKLVSTWNYLEGYSKGYSHISIPEVFWAAKSGNLGCVRFMLSNPPNPLPMQTPRAEGPWDKQYPGMYRTNDHLEPLKHVSVRGTILHYAAEGGNVDTVPYLVEQGVNPLVSNQTFEYPIHIAAAKGNLELVEYLWFICKAKGMNIDDLPDNGTLLSRAVKEGNNLALVEYLIKQGASLNCKNCFGEDVLSLINEANYSNLEIKNYILSLK